MVLIGDGGGTVSPASPPKTVSVSSKGALQSLRKTNPNDPASYINQIQDSRLSSTLALQRSPLARGVISQTSDMVGGDQKYPFACRFMFNPTTVSVGYGTDQSQTPPSDLTGAQLAATAVLPGLTTINFSLLFDRTYEVAYGPQKGLKDLRDIGCYEDVWALESVTRARVNFATTVTGADGSTTAVGPEYSNMLLTPCFVIFGGGDGSQDGKAAPGLGYAVAITSMNVTYTHFSRKMVPVRCQVDVSMSQYLGIDFDKYQANTSIKKTKASAPTSHTTSRR